MDRTAPTPKMPKPPGQQQSIHARRGGRQERQPKALAVPRIPGVGAAGPRGSDGRTTLAETGIGQSMESLCLPPGLHGRLRRVTHGIFDERVAANYDATSADMFDDAVLGSTINFLAKLADNGRALEFAIGTGRVALPLSARGVDVAGIELSQPMVDQMLAKPGADRNLRHDR